MTRGERTRRVARVPGVGDALGFVGGWAAWAGQRVSPWGFTVRALHLLAVAGVAWWAWPQAPGGPAWLAALVVAALAIGVVALGLEELAAWELAALALWWVAAGAATPWPLWVGAAALLGLAHLSAAAMASAPVHVGIGRRAAGVVAARAAGYLAVVALASGLVVAAGLLGGAVPRGWWWVALVAAAVLAGAVALARSGRR
ncbi:hypothetical protein [Propioniciclava soli]|uniref:DUF3995 domain-containing protein n=1 Tax=Propioniciclava soli TaxID=2775081 RepID=A0ABZ3C557_9ACTN|nr:hypothetical protein [Propioniciclava soli]